MSIGQTLFSLLWGYMADVKGKRPTLVASTVAVMLSTLAFGFTYNFKWAVTMRFMQGASSALTGISKSILVDVCDDSNMALAMSIVFSSSSIGFIIGPSVAGFVVFPSEHYPDVFSQDSVFGKFGILLPNVILTIGFAIGIVLIVLLLPKKSSKKSGKTQSDQKQEQLSLCEKENASEREQKITYATFRSPTNDSVQKQKWQTWLAKIKTDKLLKSFWDETEKAPLLTSIDSKEKCYPLLTNETLVSKKKSLQDVTFNFSTNESVQKRSLRSWFAKIKTYKLIKLICIKECVQVNILYCFMGIGVLGSHELFPLYAATSAEYHGMSYSTSKIGVTLLVVAALFLPTEFLVIPRVIKRYGSRKVLIGSNILLAFVCPWTPILDGIISNRSHLWIVVVFVLFLQRICMVSAFVAINIIINNAVTPDMLGSANGFAMTFLSIGRIIAPLTIGSTYSWSLTNIKDVSSNTRPLGFPFNHYFSFFVLSLMFISTGIFASTLSPSLDKKRKVEPESNFDHDGSTAHFKPDPEI